jgi:hypothetical protein
MDSNLNSYKDALKTARNDLKGRDFQEIAERAGGKFEVDYTLLPYIIHTLKIDTNTLEILFLDSSRRVDPRLEILTLHYLRDSRGIKPSGRLISFKELPHGMNYYPSFYNRTEKVLLREFKDALDSLEDICKKFGGEQCGEGDRCYKIRIFPFLPLSFVVWEGDEEFPPNTSILFDETCFHYLLAEDLAILGELVCEEMVSLKKI